MRYMTLTMRLQGKILILGLILGSVSATQAEDFSSELPEPMQGLAELPLHAAQGEFGIELSSDGRIEALRFPQGDCVSYTGARRVRTSCANGAPLPQQAPLSPIRLGVDPLKLHERANFVRKKDDFKYFEEKIQPEAVLPANRSHLSVDSQQALLAQIAKLKTCAPAAFALLAKLKFDGRIQTSNAISDTEAALVPYEKAPPILLSGRWVSALTEGEMGWTPLREHLIKADEDSISIRKRYFGSDAITIQALGEPSRDWWFLLGLLHEAGHVLQNAEAQTIDAMIYYGFAGWISTEIMISQAGWGSIDPMVKDEYLRTTAQADLWKEQVETGATYFALDLLAGCPVKL